MNVNSKRQSAQQQYNMARNNLILMIGLTLLNVIILALGSDTMMLFSATVPYFVAGMGIYSEIPFLMGVGIAIAVVILLVYFLCWLFSKKHYGWMIAALVLFGIDTLCMIGMYWIAQDFSGILDIVIHAWVMYYLIVGVRYGAQLKQLPAEAPVADVQTTYTQTHAAEQVEDAAPNTSAVNGHSNSTPLRRMDMEAKARVLAETDAFGHHICYRRVKRVNELIVDNYVYADVEMMIESAHALNAVVDGHVIQAGFDGAAHSFIRVDGETFAKKLRLY